LNVYNHWGDNEQISDFFESLRGITLSVIIKLWPNWNLTSLFLWHIHMLNLSCTTVERKLKISFFLSKLKEHYSAKNHLTMTKFKPIHMSNLSWTCNTLEKIMNENWKFHQGHNSVKNHRTIRTWPVFSHDISICQIWVECEQLLPR
jgi:hypothetical protein